MMTSFSLQPTGLQPGLRQILNGEVPDSASQFSLDRIPTTPLVPTGSRRHSRHSTLRSTQRSAIGSKRSTSADEVCVCSVYACMRVCVCVCVCVCMCMCKQFSAGSCNGAGLDRCRCRIISARRMPTRGVCGACPPPPKKILDFRSFLVQSWGEIARVGRAAKPSHCA